MYEQSLSIGGRNKEEEKLDKLSNDRCKHTLTACVCMFPSQPLLETNGQYKCLDLQQSYCDIHTWLLFSLPRCVYLAANRFSIMLTAENPQISPFLLLIRRRKIEFAR